MGSLARLVALAAILVPAAVLVPSGCSQSDPPDEPLEPRPWERLAAPSSALGQARGMRQVRGILHAHSPYSHDACDGEGLLDGAPDPACAADLRRGMCEAAEDFVLLTDHAGHMAAQDFADLFHRREGDRPILGPDGAVVANHVACGDGREVLVLVGHENSMMSLGLERHIPGDPEERRSMYQSGEDEAAIAAFHDAGALVFVPHTEQRTLEFLEAMPFDGIEIYNLHAALDPKIRGPHLGLDPFAAALGFLPFVTGEEGTPEPDLCLLSFLEDLPRYTELWDALLPLRRTVGVAGSDVHQNTLPGTMRDGERGDSYRRMMRWFSNVVLVSGELTPETLRGALSAGRSYVAFEVLGVPHGFDFHAEASGTIVELGGEAAVGATLRVRAPTVADADPATPEPEIRMRLLRVTSSGTEVVGEGATIDLEGAGEGAYRVEVRILPRHLTPHLGADPAAYLREVPWIFSNAIHLR